MFIFYLKINMYVSLAHTPLLMMVLKTCQLSTSCVLGSFGRRGLVHLALPGGALILGRIRKPNFLESPSAMPIVTASLLQTSKGEGTVNMNWRSGVTKVTLQTYIVNKQIVARNIYYSLYRAVSSRISHTRVCGKNNFAPFPHKRSPPPPLP